MYVQGSLENGRHWQLAWMMDMLPALTVGPGLYLLFIDFQNDLEECYKLTFCNASGESSIPVHSNYTVMETLFSSLFKFHFWQSFL